MTFRSVAFLSDLPFHSVSPLLQTKSLYLSLSHSLFYKRTLSIFFLSLVLSIPLSFSSLLFECKLSYTFLAIVAPSCVRSSIATHHHYVASKIGHSTWYVHIISANSIIGQSLLLSLSDYLPSLNRVFSFSQSLSFYNVFPSFPLNPFSLKKLFLFFPVQSDKLRIMYDFCSNCSTK